MATLVASSSNVYARIVNLNLSVFTDILFTTLSVGANSGEDKQIAEISFKLTATAGTNSFIIQLLSSIVYCVSLKQIHGV